MIPITAKTALLIIDVQDGFIQSDYWGRRNNPQAEENMALLLAEWRKHKRPIVHVQHMSTTPNSPLRPDSAGNAIQQIVAPIEGELIIQKTVNSAFIGTDLEARLRQDGVDSVVVVGLTTNHCVETTTRMAGNLGFVTFIVADATATFDRVGHDGVHYPAETIHAVSLASLHGEFATVIQTENLLSPDE
jgi:nicotinamidase-related amidase